MLFVPRPNRSCKSRYTPARTHARATSTVRRSPQSAPARTTRRVGCRTRPVQPATSPQNVAHAHKTTRATKRGHARPPVPCRLRTLYVSSRAAPRALASLWVMLLGSLYEKVRLLVTGKSAYVYAMPFRKKVAWLASMSWRKRVFIASCLADQSPGVVSTSLVMMSWLPPVLPPVSAPVLPPCWRRDRRASPPPFCDV